MFSAVRRSALTALIAAFTLLVALVGVAGAAEVSQSQSFTASDGTKLNVIVRGEAPLTPRPLVVEFTPYAQTDTMWKFGPAYNRVTVQVRGTGLSDGQWDAIGPRDQKDVSEALGWLCGQPYSNQSIGLFGFSASGMAAYNSMKLDLPCVKAAALGAGSNSLFRDLLYPGGIPNLIPTLAVGIGVGAPGIGANISGEGSLPRVVNSVAGLLKIGVNFLTRPTEDAWWQGHSFATGPNDFPVLAATGFYDVESRGAFENYKLLRASNPGSKLLVAGAHDGSPNNIPTPFTEYERWFDHYVRGQNNGAESEPNVRLYLGKGGHPDLRAGRWSRVDSSSWPVGGTRWQSMYLSPGRIGDAVLSRNDGGLASAPPRGPWLLPNLPYAADYPAVSSLALSSDIHTITTVGEIADSPLIAKINGADPASLTYTTKPLTQDVDVAGPAALEVYLSSTATETDIHAVVADVHPDGSAYPVGQGRLRTSFPKVIESRSVKDSSGTIVQPYNDFSAKQFQTPLLAKRYQVEFWPIGNRFEKGHRLRLYIMGTSPLMLPPLPAVNQVWAGTTMPSRLLLPLLPGSGNIPLR
jgi:predicted acyl esterase